MAQEELSQDERSPEVDVHQEIEVLRVGCLDIASKDYTYMKVKRSMLTYQHS